MNDWTAQDESKHIFDQVSPFASPRISQPRPPQSARKPDHMNMFEEMDRDNALERIRLDQDRHAQDSDKLLQEFIKARSPWNMPRE